MAGDWHGLAAVVPHSGDGMVGAALPSDTDAKQFENAQMAGIRAVSASSGGDRDHPAADGHVAYKSFIRFMEAELTNRRRFTGKAAFAYRYANAAFPG